MIDWYFKKKKKIKHFLSSLVDWADSAYPNNTLPYFQSNMLQGFMFLRAIIHFVLDSDGSISSNSLLSFITNVDLSIRIFFFFLRFEHTHHKAKSGLRLWQGEWLLIFDLWSPTSVARSWSPLLSNGSLEVPVDDFEQQGALLRRPQIRRFACAIVVAVYPVKQNNDLNRPEDPHHTYGFNVIVFKCILVLHIICAILCFYSQMFLWFQQNSVKSIERKK